ncbi:hypothetical protein [Corynebacterium flavescens]|uniref:hypothetical protein n=1 Tax=Corynebacterium flavescens TaxID=28028 RepID=UPI0023F019A2|nr:MULTISPECIES: hypothetical protein [Corynebacterium]MDN6552671.1 hypothetical protein [Corynebacterium flavescens]
MMASFSSHWAVQTPVTFFIDWPVQPLDLLHVTYRPTVVGDGVMQENFAYLNVSHFRAFLRNAK